MRKILTLFMSFIVFTMLLVNSMHGECKTPMAQFPYIAFERIAIGGIQPLTSTKEYVRSVYGDPDEIIKRPPTGRFSDSDITETWKYGGTFSIVFSEDYVFNIETTGANNLATPDGLKVGDGESKLISIYGHRGKLGYWYRSEHECNLAITVKNGKVTSIFAGWNL